MRGPSQLWDIARRTVAEGGLAEVGRRVAREVGDRWAGTRPLALLDADITHSSQIEVATPTVRPVRGTPLRIGLVCTPPALGSGGHTTAFRMVAGLERAGHECTLFLYDAFGGDPARQTLVVRQGWPHIRASVRDARQGIDGVDVVIATSWETAHALASRLTCRAECAYFLQDYEPWFHPRGWVYEMAEDTYRFGFTHLALGPLVAEAVATTAGRPSHVVEFGSDTVSYRVTGGQERRGVAFFARPDFPRRGYDLGRRTLQELHRLRPEEPIHVYGARPKDLGFAAVQHGKLSAEGLNELYNGVVAGLVPSFTNVSLVPDEMLAAGVVPVCNDSPIARRCLQNPAVAWAPATPAAMAERLIEVIESHEPSRPAQLAASVDPAGWAPAEETMVRLVETLAYDGPGAL